MDKQDNFTISALAIVSVLVLPLIGVYEFVRRKTKRKEATTSQKLYHSLLFETYPPPDEKKDVG